MARCAQQGRTATRRLSQRLGAAAAAFVAAAALSACSTSSSGGGVVEPPAAASSSAGSGSGSSSTGGSGAATTHFSLPVTHPTVWLCRPGMAKNPCEGGLDATVVRPDGTRQREPFRPAATPKVDCFYVYPTASAAAGVNAPLASAPELVRTTRAQAARFASVCRLFAPVYRQITIKGLFSGKLTPQARQLAAEDVSSAWHDYLDNDNKGRGVLLIGHSQGAFALDALMRQEVDKSADERRLLVSALLMGGNVLVPPGKDIGGDFSQIPACRRPTQHACVVAYSMFDRQPPNPSLFGRGDSASNAALGNPAKGLQVLCTNPAALSGGRAALNPYLPGPTGTGGSAGAAAADPNFVEPADLLHAECRNSGGASWLQVDSDGKTGPLRQKLVGTLGAIWGLHVYDINAALGDLVELARQQAEIWA